MNSQLVYISDTITTATPIHYAMDKKILTTGLLLLLIQLVTAFVCWLVFRELFLLAAGITLIPMFAVFFSKPKQVAK